MKSYNNYNTLIHSFEDFILLVFVLIDDLYQQYVPVSVKNRRNIKKAKLSDTECITIAICGELLGIDSEKAWYSFVKRNYHHLFPGMCSRSRFNRTRRNLMQVTGLSMEKLAGYMDFTASPYRVADSFPLPVCKFGRARYGQGFLHGRGSLREMPLKKGNLLRIQGTCPGYA